MKSVSVTRDTFLRLAEIDGRSGLKRSPSRLNHSKEVASSFLKKFFIFMLSIFKELMDTIGIMYCYRWRIKVTVSIQTHQ